MLAAALASLLLALPHLAVPGAGPQVGTIAPEPGLRWFLQEAGAPALTLAELRGRVVVLHTFAWNCASCLRVGIPLAVDLLEANESRGLTLLSITTPAYPDETKEVLERFQVRHPVAREQPFGSDNPYVDGTANPITYMYVIGRNGDLAWRGDPTTELTECVEAVALALAQPDDLAVERSLHAELGEALALYYAGSWTRAHKAAEKLRNKHARRSKGESPVIAADAELLVRQIERLAEKMVGELDEALTGGDAERIAQRRHDLLSRLAKSPWAKRVEQLLQRLDEDDPLLAAVEKAEDWRAVATSRPALFPVREDKSTKQFARDLRRFLDRHAEHPARSTAEAWLEAWETALAAK